MRRSDIRTCTVFPAPQYVFSGRSAPAIHLLQSGRLAHGVFRIERLALANPGARVFAEGSITLKGRVDLAVVAATGQVGPNVRGLRLLGLRIPAIGPLPLSLTMEVSDLLSNRTVRLTITGTVKTPIVQVNTAALLTETAVRFFLGQYVLPE